MIGENLEYVGQEIRNACKKAGRDEQSVTLIAVSKTKPVEMLREAYDAGVRDFGENRVQELLDKLPKLPADIRWHMIGHLQTNKVKYIIDKVFLIHSVDTLKLACTISEEAQKKGVEANILVEVNLAGEESKFGATREDIFSLVSEIAKLPCVHIKGLMTVAPFVENAEENRKYFHQMRELAVDILERKVDNVSMDILSMGMTGDYRVAVEEGATYVRVGTGIFGERNYQ